MSDTIDAATFAPLDGNDPALPGDPFSRPRYSYGQLLGAEDFTAEQRYHLLRARMRNALLHGFGVVTGLAIKSATQTEPPRTELRCSPGMAIDALGREIYVAEAVCLDITGLANNATFWASLSPVAGVENTRRCYAVLSYRACLSAGTPAIAPPCSDADNAFQYSRVLDSYRLCLEAAAPTGIAGLSRDWASLTDPPGLRDRLLAMMTATPGDPGQLWSVEQDAKVLLATIDLSPVGAPATDMKVQAIDPKVRALLPDVQTVASVATGLRLTGPAEAEGFVVDKIAAAAGAGADAGKLIVTVSLSADAQANTVTAQSARVFALGGAGWEARNVAASTPAGEIVLAADGPWPADSIWQVALSGGGAEPILDAAGRPLAGMAGDPVPAPGRGRDVCLTATTSP